GADLTIYCDTWAYNSAANTWTNLKPAGDVPPPRGGHTMVYDPVSRKTILFGGAFLVLYLGDTWSFGHGEVAEPRPVGEGARCRRWRRPRQTTSARKSWRPLRLSGRLGRFG